MPTLGAAGGAGTFAVLVWGTWYYATPDFFEVGYMPTQPEAGFNHQLHAGELGMNCVYCHHQIEESPIANVPPIATCYGCHSEQKLAGWENHDVKWIRTAYAQDEAVPWRKVHKLPDYVRHFPHHVHIQAGVSCYSCHGQIMGMPVVYQAHSLSMGWCLDCHRNPEEHLVPPERVTQLTWVSDELAARAEGAGTVDAAALVESLRRAPPQACGACHH
ncbi:MAG: cytochrome c3 family protein [Planctomycetota bacterium]